MCFGILRFSLLFLGAPDFDDVDRGYSFGIVGHFSTRVCMKCTRWIHFICYPPFVFDLIEFYGFSSEPVVFESDFCLFVSDFLNV